MRCLNSCSFPWKLAAAGAVGSLALCIYQAKKKIDLGSVFFSRKWFTEISPFFPGQALSLEVKKVLFEGRSKYQDIKVLETSTYGRILVLDGVIQVTEKDECAYQEMMAHIPLFAHRNPQKVLVVGGGDGGILREISKHRGVKEIHICELDQMVIDVSKKYMPGIACGFDDPRVRVHVMDGNEFVANCEKNEFDVIITDSSDPVGPAEVLFHEPYYRAAVAALKPGGVAVMQGECLWIHQEMIEEIHHLASRLFETVNYGWFSVPTYPCGSIGLLCCVKHTERVPSDEKSRVSEEDVIDVTKPGRTDENVCRQMQYYTPDIHRAAFVLPAFARGL